MARACADDPELQQIVLDMLHEDREQQPLLDADLSGLAQAALHNDQVEALVAQEIGPYRLVRLLGEGGSGVVYLAERSHLGGSVAIKLLRHAWMSPMRRERFAQEQRTLARLNHPGIAHIYDAGTLGDGVPWFVMEYVDGVPLHHWMEAHGTSLPEVLLLFAQICEAVRYAHSLAIIHRDLKPSNILVTAENKAKLLDFGIAKQLGTEQDPLRTMDGLRLMTPAYAAPEQQAGGAIGVFTDVYALGVILYEMLCGSLPVPSHPGAPAADGTPVPPSTRVPRGPFAVARSQVPRREWVDLDALCLTALAPQPEQRYRTVDALLGDVQAFLEGRPLLAQPPAWHRTALKFVRRNRAAVAAVVLGLLLLTIASTVFTVRLARARDEALNEAARVKRIQGFTESLFEGGDPQAGPAADLKVSDLLKRGETEAESLGGDPQMQADMYTTLGTVYEQLGALPKAESLLERALDERRRSLGPQAPEVVDSVEAMGLLRKNERRMDEAEQLLRQVVDRRRALRDTPGLEQALVDLGSVLSLHGQYATARTLLTEAQGSERARGATGTALYAQTLGELADISTYQAHYEEAEALDRDALALDRRLFGERHPASAALLEDLGSIASNRGHYTEAGELFRRAVEAYTAWYGPSHPEVADALTSLSNVYVMQKRFNEADALLSRALTIDQQAYGERHAQIGILWNQIGSLAYSRDQDDKAEHAFRRAIAIFTEVYGPTHQFVGLAYSNLAGVDIDRNDLPSAERDAADALRIYAVSLPPDHVNIAIVHAKMGKAYRLRGLDSQSAEEYLSALHYFVRHPEQNPEYPPVLKSALGKVAAHMTDRAAAGQLLHTTDAMFSMWHPR